MTSLYIHIPFCYRKCFYCSFCICIGQEKNFDDYVDAILNEAQKYSGLKINSIYFGGGTPSILSSLQIEKLFINLKKIFCLQENSEVTIEANPESITREKLECFRLTGINRISVGIQTFNDSFLKYLGRNHNSGQAMEAINLIHSMDFDNVSLDLMYGIPGQSLLEIEKDIRFIEDMNVGHVSLYSLSIDEKSLFNVRKELLPSKETQAEQYQYVLNEISKRGFRQYEISNFAKEGKESFHNSNYWQGGNYIGLGLAAHSHMNGRRFWNGDLLSEYMRRAKVGEEQCQGEEFLTTDKRLIETFLFGLRMNVGVDWEMLKKRFNCDFKKEQYEAIDRLLEEKLLEKDGRRIKVTDEGRLVLDEICSYLI